MMSKAKTEARKKIRRKKKHQFNILRGGVAKAKSQSSRHFQSMKNKRG